MVYDNQAYDDFTSFLYLPTSNQDFLRVWRTLSDQSKMLDRERKPKVRNASFASPENHANNGIYNSRVFLSVYVVLTTQIERLIH